jgi:predicted nucleic acid-binding protein
MPKEANLHTPAPAAGPTLATQKVTATNFSVWGVDEIHRKERVSREQRSQTKKVARQIEILSGIQSCRHTKDDKLLELAVDG